MMNLCLVPILFFALANASSLLFYEDQIRSFGSKYWSPKERSDLLNDYAVQLNSYGQKQKALEIYKEATTINPNNFAAQTNYAMLLKDLGEIELAMEASKKAVQLNPNNSGVLNNHGSLLTYLDVHEESIQFYEQAVALDPFCVPALTSLGNVEGKKANYTGAALFYKKALEAAQSSNSEQYRNSIASLKFQVATAVIPHIYLSLENIHSVREKYERNLMQLIDYSSSGNDFTMNNPLESVGAGGLGYYIIYQGFNDVHLRRLQAKIYWKASKASLVKTAPFLFDDKGALDDTVTPMDDGRIRVGFYGAFLYHHSVGLLTQGVIRNIDRSEFHVTVLVQSRRRINDEVFQNITSAADSVVAISYDIDVAMLEIGDQKLDVLIFTEIGMDILSYFLPFARLAKRTALFWGHAITSGISNYDAKNTVENVNEELLGGIDYFVSSNLFEDANSDPTTRYSETLYLMEGLTTYFYHPMPPKDVSRDYFDLPFNKNIYLCPQTLYKLHPDFDKLVIGILMNDDDALVVFPAGQRGEWTGIVLDRIKAAVERDNAASFLLEDRIHFVPWMSFDEFNALSKLANVVLDPFPVGGGRSSFEILSVGTPIVMLYPRTSILQLTYGMYKTMGILDCVTYSDDEYIKVAVTIGTNRAVELSLRQRINQNKHLIYESALVIDEWNKFLWEIAANPRPSRNPDEGNDNPSIDGIIKIPANSVYRSLELNDSSVIFAMNADYQDAESMEWKRIQVKLKSGDCPIRSSEYIGKILKAEPMRRRYLSRVFQHGVNRYNERVVGRHSLELPEVTIQFSVYEGDDLALLANFLAIQHGINNQGKDIVLNQLFELHPAHSSPTWIAIRHAQDKESLGINPPRRKLIESSSNQGGCFLTIAMTSCKRLNLFKETAFSLLKFLGENYQSQVCEIIVVDDNSSANDRLDMEKSFPQFSYFWKGDEEKGHAKSMNMIMEKVKTRYLLYLEDDWLLLHDNFQEMIEKIMCIFEDTENMPVDQVLLNDQSSRQCAEGLSNKCNGSAGWKRTTSANGNSCTTAREYVEHEFGVIYPRHSFSYWAGFSLNPGIWDLERISKKIEVYFNETDVRFEQSFSLNAMDAGVVMAHLPKINVRHTGNEVSSYTLNGLPRPWDN